MLALVTTTVKRVVVSLSAVVAAFAAASSASQSDAHQEYTMSLNATGSASRVGPSPVSSIAFEGKRYEQVLNGEREGLSQRTGLMSVLDLSTGERRIVKIYDEPRDPRMESDAGDVFFTRFEIDEARRAITITNERHRIFVYDIDTSGVIERQQGSN